MRILHYVEEKEKKDEEESLRALRRFSRLGSLSRRTSSSFGLRPSEMEISQVTGRFSASPLRLRYVRQTFVMLNARKSAFLPHLVCSLHSRRDMVSSGATNRMFILGMGFVGQFFAEQLKKDGWDVSGTCFTMNKKKKLEEMGLDVCLFDANEPELRILSTLEHATHLLVSIPPVVGVGDQVLQHSNLLKIVSTNENLQWLGYLSSTSVYGDCGGAWVDETSPTNPTSESAEARVAAEEGWLDLGDKLGLSVQIFRLGGVYGPGRSAIDTIIKQEPLSEGQRMRESRQYTSRVHVADICQALKASFCMPSSRKVYNVVDDDPTPRVRVFAFARDLVEEKWPGQVKQMQHIDSASSIIHKETAKAGKRVSNVRLKKDLGVTLLYPNYRSGLRSIIDRVDGQLK